MVKSIVRSDLKKSTRQLLTTISNFPEEYFNTHAKEGRWAAGQIAEHLIKVETGTVRFFTEETESSDRNPEQKISKVKRAFVKRRPEDECQRTDHPG